MTRYFAKDTPLAGLERMMMSVPGFQHRGSGIRILNRFRYRAEDLNCRYCLHYQRKGCIIPVCPYIAERLESGAIGYRELVMECFGTIPHTAFQQRIRAVENWDGPDQGNLTRMENWQTSCFCEKESKPNPSWLAAAYLLASRESLWQAAFPALSYAHIDFHRVGLHGFSAQDYPLFYAAKRLYARKPPMAMEELSDPHLIKDSIFLDIIYAVLIARYGAAVMQKRRLIP